MTIEITLPKDLEERVAALVRSGDYASPSEVVRDALLGWLPPDDAEVEEVMAYYYREVFPVVEKNVGVFEEEPDMFERVMDEVDRRDAESKA